MAAGCDRRSVCASDIAWAGVLLRFRQAWMLSVNFVDALVLVHRQLAVATGRKVRATLAARTLAMKSFIVSVSYAAGLVAI